MKSVIVFCLAFIAMFALVQSVPVESFAEGDELFGEEVAIIDLDQGKNHNCSIIINIFLCYYFYHLSLFLF